MAGWGVRQVAIINIQPHAAQLVSGSMEHHLSIFRPYERDAKHEDQLTRAALIVMKLVPLAHEAFLGLAGCERMSALPRPHFEMQTGKLVTPDPDAEDP